MPLDSLLPRESLFKHTVEISSSALPPRRGQGVPFHMSGHFRFWGAPRGWPHPQVRTIRTLVPFRSIIGTFGSGALGSSGFGSSCWDGFASEVFSNFSFSMFSFSVSLCVASRALMDHIGEIGFADLQFFPLSIPLSDCFPLPFTLSDFCSLAFPPFPPPLPLPLEWSG